MCQGPIEHRAPQKGADLRTVSRGVLRSRRQGAQLCERMRAENCTVSFYRYIYDTVGRPWLWFERRLVDDAALEALLAKYQDEGVTGLDDMKLLAIPPLSAIGALMMEESA